MSWIKANKTKIFLILAIVVLAVVAINQFDEKSSYKNVLIQYRSVPHMELQSLIFTTETDNFLHLYVKGFVAFRNESDQPKGMSQYYVIEPLFRRDENNKQLFSLTEIIAMNAIPPREIGTGELREKENTSQYFVLEDDGGNLLYVNKATKEIALNDATGDEAYLITSDLDYGDFMRDFLR